MMKQTPEELLDKYIAGKCDADEKATLETWYLLHTEAAKDILPEPDYMALQRVMWQVIAPADLPARKPVKLWFRIAAAAAVIVAVVGAGLFYSGNFTGIFKDHKQAYVNDVDPGKNTATLTLANGKTIKLSDAKAGVIIEANSLKYNDGSALEQEGIHETNLGQAKQSYNEVQIKTPRGGQYQITLPDGTHVWLNAASSIKFPSTFANLKVRRVELTGEAYFEVAKDKAHPFIAKTARQEVEVLGTHFNINSYADEEVAKTTLIEGSVKVNEGVVLKPGQQSILSRSGSLKVGQVNVEDAIDWKNNKFTFLNSDIEGIMRKIARWYDLEVIYVDKPTDQLFVGEISRFEKVSKVLGMLELTGAVHFVIKGRSVMVYK